MSDADCIPGREPRSVAASTFSLLQLSVFAEKLTKRQLLITHSTF